MIINDELIINKSKEVQFTRFKKRPDELVWRLMIELIGREKLKSMTALGKSRGEKGKERKEIPETVMNAVYSVYSH